MLSRLQGMRAAGRAVGGAVRRGMSTHGQGASSRGAKFGAFATAAALGGGGLAMATAQSPAHAESASGAPTFSETLTEKALRLIGLGGMVDFVVEPAERPGCPKGKLLPDPPALPPGVTQRTLVISLEECLVHTEWDRKRGHRTMKRPGLDAFLAHVSQFYEIVIFTTAQASYAQPIAQELQNLAYVQHALFKESCKYTGGKYVKDLSTLNRDEKNIIIIDTNPDNYALQPHNAIHISEWNGDLDDTQLLDLVPFLEAVFKEDIPDVRDVLSVWPADSVPDRFRGLKRQVMERKKKGGNALMAGQVRRGAPGVLPVLSTMIPTKSPSISLSAAKADGGEASKKVEVGKKQAAAEAGVPAAEASASAPAKVVDPKKSLFDKAKGLH